MPRRASSGDPSPRCAGRSRTWACGRCCATRRPTATASRAATRVSPRATRSSRKDRRRSPGRWSGPTRASRSRTRASTGWRRRSGSAASALHVHAAEDRADVEDAVRRGASGVVDRLRRHGLVGRDTILVHAVHLGERELQEAQDAGAWVVHCPRSNMNNAVGHARTEAFRRAALGTDGMDEDMLAEARAAFLRMRDAGRLRRLRRGRRHAGRGPPPGLRRSSASPSAGSTPGRPPTSSSSTTGRRRRSPPTTSPAHLLFGLDRSHVRSTMVAGRFVLQDRRIVTVDEAAVLARAQAAAARLWERMRKL